jgi:hypothetical protein
MRALDVELLRPEKLNEIAAAKKPMRPSVCSGAGGVQLPPGR